MSICSTPFYFGCQKPNQKHLAVGCVKATPAKELRRAICDEFIRGSMSIQPCTTHSTDHRPLNNIFEDI